MNNQEMYVELVKLRDEAFDNIFDYIAKHGMGYISCSDTDKVNGIIEFSVGQFKLLLAAEIVLYNRRVEYKVSTRTLKTEYYPNEIRYNETHIKELNMFSNFSKSHQFELTKESNKSDFKNLDRPVPVTNFPISSFGENLIEQTEKWLLSQEQKNIEK